MSSCIVLFCAKSKVLIIILDKVKSENRKKLLGIENEMSNHDEKNKIIDHEIGYNIWFFSCHFPKVLLSVSKTGSFSLRKCLFQHAKEALSQGHTASIVLLFKVFFLVVLV